MTKLTAPQKRELKFLAGEDQPYYYDDAYKPIVRLVELGYVERRDGRLMTAYSITTLGREALEGTP